MKKITLLFLLINLSAIAQDSSSTAYFNRSGITDSAEQYAANTLIVGLKYNNLWTRCVALYAVSPTCYGAAAHNLVDSSHMLHGGVAPKFSVYGLEFNGVNQYLRAGINASLLMPYNYTIVERVRQTSTTGIDFGCAVSGVNTSTNYIYVNTTTARLGAYSTATLLSGSTAGGTGNYFFNVYSSTSRGIRKNKTSLITSTAAVSGTQPYFEYYLGAINTSGTAGIFANRQITTFGIFSPSLTIAEQNILSDLIDTYNLNVIPGGR